eukprot:scaffold3216_cov76-Isochrysis_galbana.AAC.1
MGWAKNRMGCTAKAQMAATTTLYPLKDSQKLRARQHQLAGRVLFAIRSYSECRSGFSHLAALLPGGCGCPLAGEPFKRVHRRAPLHAAHLKTPLQTPRRPRRTPAAPAAAKAACLQNRTSHS